MSITAAPSTPLRDGRRQDDDANDPLRTVRATREQGPSVAAREAAEESVENPSFSFKKRLAGSARSEREGSPSTAGRGKRSLSGLFMRRSSGNTSSSAGENMQKHLDIPSASSGPVNSTPAKRSPSDATVSNSRKTSGVIGARSISRTIPTSPITPSEGTLGRRIQEWQIRSGTAASESRHAPGSSSGLKDEVQELIVPRMLPTLAVQAHIIYT